MVRPKWEDEVDDYIIKFIKHFLLKKNDAEFFGMEVKKSEVYQKLAQMLWNKFRLKRTEHQVQARYKTLNDSATRYRTALKKDPSYKGTDRQKWLFKKINPPEDDELPGPTSAIPGTSYSSNNGCTNTGNNSCDSNNSIDQSYIEPAEGLGNSVLSPADDSSELFDAEILSSVPDGIPLNNDMSQVLILTDSSDQCLDRENDPTQSMEEISPSMIKETFTTKRNKTYLNSLLATDLPNDTTSMIPLHRPPEAEPVESLQALLIYEQFEKIKEEYKIDCFMELKRMADAV